MVAFYFPPKPNEAGTWAGYARTVRDMVNWLSATLQTPGPLVAYPLFLAMDLIDNFGEKTGGLEKGVLDKTIIGDKCIQHKKLSLS